MTSLKSAALPVAGPTAQSQCRATLKHIQSYTCCLHQHPLTVAEATASPSPLHSQAACAPSGSSLGMWVSPMGAVAHLPPEAENPCDCSEIQLHFHITAVNRFDGNLEALNLVSYIRLWRTAGQKIQK